MTRQIVREEFHALRVDSRRLLSEGYTWIYSPEPFLLGVGDSHAMAFATGEHPVSVDEVTLTVGGASYLHIEFYIDGILTGGVPVFGLPANHHKQQPAPLNTFADVINVAGGGTLIGQEYALGDRASASWGRLILAPESQYYLQLTNVGILTPSFSSDWIYQVGQGSPASGVAIQSNQGDVITFSYLDALVGDKEAELRLVQPGWFITTNVGDSWTVTTTTPGESDIAFGVAPSAQSSGSGALTFEFSEPAIAPDVLVSMSMDFAALSKAELF